MIEFFPHVYVYYTSCRDFDPWLMDIFNLQLLQLHDCCLYFTDSDPNDVKSVDLMSSIYNLITNILSSMHGVKAS